MKVMIVSVAGRAGGDDNGSRYLINTELAQHVLDGICEDILKYYPSDATVEFDDVKPSDIRP